MYKKLQRLAGYTARVVELLEAVDEDSRPDDARLAVQVHSRPSIVFEDVSIESPDGRLLLKARPRRDETCGGRADARLVAVRESCGTCVFVFS